MSAISIRRLGVQDWQSYRALRLEALADTPLAFRTQLHEAEALPDSAWQDMFAEPRMFWGAEVDGQLRGSVNFGPEGEGVVAHKGWLYGMYVSPEARGTGASVLLVEALIDYARTTPCRQVHLGVGTFNDRARALYERMGFEQYGIEPRGQIVNDTVVDEILMVRFLDKESSCEKSS